METAEKVKQCARGLSFLCREREDSPGIICYNGQVERSTENGLDRTVEQGNELH